MGPIRHRQHAAHQCRLYRHGTRQRRQDVLDDDARAINPAAIRHARAPISGSRFTAARRQQQRRHEPLAASPRRSPARPSRSPARNINDLTGDGFSCDDNGLGGVTIDLYNSLAEPRQHDKLVAATTTASDGTYAFTVCPRDVLRPGSRAIRLRPDGRRPERLGRRHLLHDHGRRPGTPIRQRFRRLPDPDLHADQRLLSRCTTTAATRPRSATCAATPSRGTSVTVTFTVTARHERPAHPGELHRPGPIVQRHRPPTSSRSSTRRRAPSAHGTHTLTVCIPNCDYQIDFVCGPAIDELGPPKAAWPGQQQHLLYAARPAASAPTTAARKAYRTKQVCSGDYATSGFWCTTNGQKLHQ